MKKFFKSFLINWLYFTVIVGVSMTFPPCDPPEGYVTFTFCSNSIIDNLITNLVLSFFLSFFLSFLLSIYSFLRKQNFCFFNMNIVYVLFVLLISVFSFSSENNPQNVLLNYLENYFSVGTIIYNLSFILLMLTPYIILMELYYKVPWKKVFMK